MRTTRRMAIGALLVATLFTAACGSGGTNDATGGGSGAAGDNGGGDNGDNPAPTTTEFKPRTFTIAASGDILLHYYVIQDGKTAAKGNGYDFNSMFDQVRDTISAADLAICHQETPISANNTNLTKSGTLVFNAPKEIATALKNAGFDGCDTASNHTYDQGLKGVKETLDVLDAAGLKHAGGSRDQAEADNPPIYDVKGVKVGHLAYSYTITNNAGPDKSVPADAPWLKSMLWPAIGKDQMIADAKKLRDRGAQFVVMSIHWGDQYIHQPNAQQRQLAKDLLSSPDVDLILGDHVHVVQPCEKINDKYVIYGMGNFLSNQSPEVDRTLVYDNQDGSLSTWTVTETAPNQFKTVKMEYVPTYVIIKGHPIVPATPDKYKQSYDRTVKNMNLLGPGACDATPAF